MRFKRVLRGVEGEKKKKPVQSTGQGENVLKRVNFLIVSAS
jgi:hypothetical protein